MVQEHVGDRILLVGTAHVSPESVQEVESAVATFQPDVVAVELDGMRLEALEHRQQWENTPVHKLLKSDRLWLFLTQILLASYQRRLGEQYGAEPGAEMLAGVNAARAAGKEVLLADRDVGITMQRAYRSMRFGEKARLGWELFKAMFTPAGDEEPETPMDLVQEDAVSAMMKELGDLAPSIKKVVIDERDVYLSTKVQGPAAEGKKVLAVVGAGHLPGIRARLQAGAPPADLKPLETIPAQRFSITKFILGWGFLVLLFGLFGYFIWQGFATGKWDDLVRLIGRLFLYGGGLAALGCLVARGHPLSVLTAFAVAPFTILHPGLAAGWFSGIVEAKFREPRVLDFRKLSQITTVKAFFNNRVVRVLIVAALTNVGAMIGAAITLGKSWHDIFRGGTKLVDLLAGLGARLGEGDPKAWVGVALVAVAVTVLAVRGRRQPT